MQANQPSKLSRQFLKNLYESKCSSSHINPILQILAFQESFHQPHSQIIVRLSDGVVFIDCSLVGSYCIKDNKIMSIDSGQSQIQFNAKDLVKLTDYFSKIDNRRICQLRVMIIKMQLAEKLSSRIGYPSELRQYFQNIKEQNRLKNGVNGTHNPDIRTQKPQSNNLYTVYKKGDTDIIKIQDQHEEVRGETLNQSNSRVSNQIKPKVQKRQPNQNFNEMSNLRYHQNSRQLQNQRTSQSSELQQPLSYNQIIQGKDGYFLGRLVRMKMANKQTKQGPMSVLYLGFLDRLGQLVRVNMAGRLAMKQQRQLKKGKCYYIKDLQVYQTQKMPYPQIRLKDKQYRIVQVQQSSITQRFAKSYYHWDHQHQILESDNVDIIGVIDQIEQKACYPHSNQKREVIRIVIRNKFKTVKINFWAQQIKVLSFLRLKKRQAIILQDIKKKKNIFLDYQYQSSLIRLEQNPALKQQLKDLLPACLDPHGEPNNIKQLSQIYEEQANGNKIISLKMFLMRMQQNRIIYKLCSYCRRKVQKFSQTCSDCNKNQFYFKFNCQLQFADFSGSLNCVAFEFSAQKLLGKSATQINELSSDDLMKLIDDHLFRQYEIILQNRSCKFIVRNVQALENSKQYTKGIRQNIREIQRHLSKRRQRQKQREKNRMG